MDEIIQELTDAMRDLDEIKVLNITRSLIESECSSFEIQIALNDGMQGVGKRFETGEYFLADLIVSGIIYKNAMEIFQSGRTVTADHSRGSVVIGVVENDIHEIGKDIVSEALRASGFKVIDLGVDVSTEAFIEAVERHRPDILALSGVMGFALDSMALIVSELEQRGLRDGLAVVIGGSCVANDAASLIRADKMAVDSLDTIAFCEAVTDKKYE